MFTESVTSESIHSYIGSFARSSGFFPARRKPLEKETLTPSNSPACSKKEGISLHSFFLLALLGEEMEEHPKHRNFFVLAGFQSLPTSIGACTRASSFTAKDWGGTVQSLTGIPYMPIWKESGIGSW